MRLTRIIIHAKDIQRITGKTERYGRELIRRMRVHFNKAQHQFISIDEFCSYTGLSYDDIKEMIEK